MQHPDIEKVGNRRRVRGNQVFVYRSVGETPPVDRHRQVINPECLRGAAGKHGDIRRQGQLASDHALGVVVALHDEHADVRPSQAHHLLAKEQTGVKILPVTVVDVAGE